MNVVANVKPGRADKIRSYGNKLVAALKADPYLLAPLKLHYLRWVLFDNDTRFMYQGIFETDIDVYTEDARLSLSLVDPDRQLFMSIPSAHLDQCSFWQVEAIEHACAGRPWLRGRVVMAIQRLWVS